MRGQYHMMDWEEDRWKTVFSKAIEKFAEDRDPPYEEILTQQDICPANVVHVLELLGWEDTVYDTNGWQNDTWYYFSHPDYDFEIGMYYEGYTFELKLYRRYRD